jgi:alkylhydroperoxidase family enzyme
LAHADIDPDAQAELCGAFPRAARFFTDAPDAPPLPAVLGVLAHHPTLAAGWLAHNGALLDHGVLDARVRELVVLAVVHRTGTASVWNEHIVLGRAAGITDDELQRLERGARDGWSELDATLLRAVDELVDEFTIADPTWKALAEQFDERSLLELLFVVGTYTCLAMVMNSVGLAPTGTPR